jgi:hypothetical protein
MVTTLLVLPAIFVMFQGRAGVQSASLDPDDAGSPYFDPQPEGPVSRE